MTATPRRRIGYISGTRADFGLMQATLEAIHHDPRLELGIIATGMHLSRDHGHTLDDVNASGLPVWATVPVDMNPPTGATMARNLGLMLAAFVPLLQAHRPDVVLLLGDRGEMLAGALAAIHLNIPVAHIHGGERSGTVDEPVRHAISKLAHFHLTATEQARERLVRMGEDPQHIWVTGAPGLDGLRELASIPREALLSGAGIAHGERVALLVFHPVLQEAASAGAQATAVLDSLRARGLAVVALLPNADAGSEAIRQVLIERAQGGQLHLATHLPRREFVSWMAAADLMVGNSSAGIIEAASFGTPVVNIGLRQNLRERNANVFDCAAEPAAIEQALETALRQSCFTAENVYGDGATAPRIVERLATLPLNPQVLLKTNAY